MTPTTYGRDFAYCLKSHGGVRGFNASLWRFLLRCTLFCHSVATFLTSVSSYEGGCGFEETKKCHWELLGSGWHFFLYVYQRTVFMQDCRNGKPCAFSIPLQFGSVRLLHSLFPLCRVHRQSSRVLLHAEA